MSLQDLINDKKILKIDNVTIKEVRAIFNKAVRFFNSAKKGLQLDLDDLVCYSNAYDATRIAGEAVLLLKGYRVRKGEGFHIRIFDAVKEVINGELGNVLIRIERRRSKRHRIQYGSFDISRKELIEAIKDAEVFIKKIEKIIKKEESQKSLL